MSEEEQLPNEEELRRALEEQLRNARVDDLLVQSTVSLINLSARRIAVEDERDLEQAKLGIDAVKALVDFLPEQVRGQVREALTQLQFQFAQVAGPGSAQSASESHEPESPAGTGSSGGGASGLWTPPGVG